MEIEEIKEHKHEFVEYKCGEDSLNFCRICGYNKEFGFISNRFITKKYRVKKKELR